MIPKLIHVLKTVQKSVVKRLKEFEIRGRIDSIRTAELLRSAIVLRKIQGT